MRNILLIILFFTAQILSGLVSHTEHLPEQQLLDGNHGRDHRQREWSRQCCGVMISPTAATAIPSGGSQQHQRNDRPASLGLAVAVRISSSAGLVVIRSPPQTINDEKMSGERLDGIGD